VRTRRLGDYQLNWVAMLRDLVNADEACQSRDAKQQAN